MSANPPKTEPIELRDIDAALLIGAFRELEYWASRDPRDFAWGQWRERAKHEDAVQGSVDVAIATWLGHAPSGAERRSASRALARLHEAGLIVRRAYQSSPGRTSAITFTESGRKLAEQLAKK